MSPRKRKILKWGGGALVLLAVAWTVWNGLASRQLAAAVAEHAEAGFPTTFDELRRQRGLQPGESPKLPSSENAAFLYSAAFSLAEMHPVDGPVWPEDGGLPVVTEVTRKSIDRLGPAFDLLHRAADVPRCQYRMEFGDRTNMRMEHIPRMQRARNLLVWRGAMRLEKADVAGALADTRALFALARSAREDPILIAQLVSVSLTLDATKLLEHVLPRADDPRAALAEASVGSVTGAIATGMRGEYVYGLTALTEESIPRGWILESTLLWPKSKSDLARSASYLRRYSELCALPWLEARERMVELEAEALAQGGIYAEIFLPGVVRLREREAEVEARLALAHVAAACLARRQASGGWPPTLEGLDVPLDPLSGKAFLLEPDGEHLVLRSPEKREVSWIVR